MSEFPQSPQLFLSLSDVCADSQIPRSPQSSETVGIGDRVRREKTSSVTASVAGRGGSELRKLECASCRRFTERVDEEFEQCARCNADDIRMAGLEILMDSLPPSETKRFLAEWRDLQ